MCEIWAEAHFFALGRPLALTPFVEKAVPPGWVLLHLCQIPVEDIEATQMSIDRGMDKEDVVPVYKGV